MPAPAGNKNAQKDNPKSERLYIRVRPSDKARWMEQAKAQGLTLSQYIEGRLK